jgi:uncharacterized protein YggE
MNHDTNRFDGIITAVIISCIVILGIYLIPWDHITWGKLKLLSGDTVTVVGEGKTKQKTQKATFSAGVSAVSDDKNTAVNEVNTKTAAIIDAVKTFGITSDNIKTQNMNVYQNQESYWEDNRQKQRPGQWFVNNTIEITLSNVERAQDLANLLTKSGATNVNGPNFSLDDTTGTESSLLDDALTNAREKANRIAKSSGKKLGSVVSVVEGYQSQPVYRFEGARIGGGGAALEPGTGTVTKTVTVTYELAR